MEKVYRLMHNNIERGPFSIDELLQQNIQPSDLIWEEGKGKWQFASQIDELNRPQSSRGSHPDTVQNGSESAQESRTTSSREWAQANDHFFADKKEFELRAQELKKEVSMYTPSYHAMPGGDRLRTDTAGGRDLYDHIDLVIHKTEKSKHHSQFLLTCLVFGLFIYGWYKGAIVNREAQNEDIAARPLIIPTSSEVPKEAPIPNNTVALAPPVPLDIEEAPPKPARQGKATLKKPSQTLVNKKESPDDMPQPVPQTTVSSVEATEVEAPVQEPAESTEPAATTIERKKTFGQAIKGLFKKKNRKVDTAMGE
jgi:hypothetical protein